MVHELDPAYKHELKSAHEHEHKLEPSPSQAHELEQAPDYNNSKARSFALEVDKKHVLLFNVTSRNC